MQSAFATIHLQQAFYLLTLYNTCIQYCRLLKTKVKLKWLQTAQFNAVYLHTFN